MKKSLQLEDFLLIEDINQQFNLFIRHDKSVVRFKIEIPKQLHLITKDEIIGGGESVGIIIQGKNFKSRYFGNYLNSIEICETATILQVSASAYAAFVHRQSKIKMV